MFALAATPFQPVDLNVATVEQIALLPGIGKHLAEAIVAHRRKHGAFTSTAQLKLIQGMTQKKLDLIAGQIIFGKIGKPPKPVLPETKHPFSQKPIIDLPHLEERMLVAQRLVAADDISREQRVRRAAWLPKLSASLDFDRADAATKRDTERSYDSMLTRDGRALGVGMRVSFDLDKLIYTSEELEVAKLALKREEKRDELREKLRRNYFRYLELAATPVGLADTDLKTKLQFEMAEIAAYFDSVSQGAFSSFDVDFASGGVP